MEECSICGISEGKAFLFDAISDKGIIKICKNCLEKENFPLIRKTDVYEVPKRQKVYETLSKLSGIKKEPKEELIEQEKNLKDIVDENFKKVVSLKTESPENLVRNFHWIIMRARKTRHITQKQLGEAVSEPEIAIKMAEKGILPEFNSKFIEKLENYLKINLKKKLEPKPVEKKSEDISIPSITQSDELKKEKKEIEEFGIDFDNTRNLTISDLKKMKEEKEEEILEKENFEEENYEEDNEDNDEDDFWEG